MSSRVAVAATTMAACACGAEAFSGARGLRPVQSAPQLAQEGLARQPEPREEAPAGLGLGLASAAGIAGLGAAAFAGHVRPRRAAGRGRAAARAAEGQRAIPFLPPPKYWEFAKGVPGDAGFDPLDFWRAETTGTFAGVELSMRDAEIKHCRLAMLAAVHWPLAELYHPQLADALHMDNRLAEAGLNPSLLNGGLLTDPYLLGFAGVAAFAAGLTDLSKAKGSAPGDHGFDPLGLKGVAPPVLPGVFGRDPKQWAAEAEVTHGRAAMIGIVAYAFQELNTGVPVVQETPQLFQAPF